MKAHFDVLTRDLFEVPVELSPTPGALDCGETIRRVLADLIKKAAHSRAEIAEQMSLLTGKKITDHSLDSWTADSREGWRFPLEYLPAFEVATETRELTAWMADLRGCRLPGAGREGRSGCRNRQAGAHEGRRRPAHSAAQERDRRDAIKANSATAQALYKGSHAA